MYSKQAFIKSILLLLLLFFLFRFFGFVLIQKKNVSFLYNEKERIARIISATKNHHLYLSQKTSALCCLRIEEMFIFSFIMLF